MITTKIAIILAIVLFAWWFISYSLNRLRLLDLEIRIEKLERKRSTKASKARKKWREKAHKEMSIEMAIEKMEAEKDSE